MSLIARLRSYAVEAFGVGAPFGGGPVDDTHLAATALLVHVAWVDGILAPSESERLSRLVQRHYADGPDAARALIARATATLAFMCRTHAEAAIAAARSVALKGIETA